MQGIKCKELYPYACCMYTRVDSLAGFCSSREFYALYHSHVWEQVGHNYFWLLVAVFYCRFHDEVPISASLNYQLSLQQASDGVVILSSKMIAIADYDEKKSYFNVSYIEMNSVNIRAATIAAILPCCAWFQSSTNPLYLLANFAVSLIKKIFVCHNQLASNRHWFWSVLAKVGGYILHMYRGALGSCGIGSQSGMHWASYS